MRMREKSWSPSDYKTHPVTARWRSQDFLKKKFRDSN